MAMKIFRPIVVLACALIAASCTTEKTSNPARTATEELLISTAADRAAAQLALPIPKGAKVFIDATNFDGTDSKYAIGAIREAVLRRGAAMTDDKKTAQTIIEIRSGALSTDEKTFLIGIPSFNIPIPFASAPVAFPQIALYGTDDQKGVAKFAMFGYDAKTGALVTPPQEPRYGFSHNIQKTLLIFYTWTDSDMLPNDSAVKQSYEEIVPLDKQTPAPGAGTSSK
jgi:hypothetical protein